MKKKATINIYVVMQVHKNYRSFCDIFTSFEEADNRFEELLNYYKHIEKVQPIGWTTETIPYQLKVSIIKDVVLYLCKETKEIDIKIDSKEPIFDEPKFKPFSYADDCIKEMLKHSPFGIVKTKENIYCTVLDISEYGITILNDYNKPDRIDFEYASKFIKFLDGSPFGYII